MTVRRILPRRGTAAQWTAANPVLGVGELGFETDTKKSKRGDGTTAWNALSYDLNAESVDATAAKRASMNAENSAVAARLQSLLLGKASGIYIRSKKTAITATTTTLAASAPIGATTLSLTATLKVGRYLIDSEVVTITNVTGAGPYTATLAAPTTAAHASAAAVTGIWRDYELIRGIGDGRYVIYELSWAFSNTYLDGLTRLRRCRLASPMLSVVMGDASIVRTGTWSSISSDVRAYNGQYRQSTEVGAYFTFTPPANTTAIGWRGPRISNGGLAKVTIDGSATKANLLPTAQQVVDRGLYANTILVANGGTLNPTDRVLSCFGSTDYGAMVGIADGLTASDPNVVVATVTGYTAVGGAGNRLYLSGMSWATAATTIETPSIELVDTYSVHNEATVSSAWEYADSERPVGSSNAPIFTGSVHGYEQNTSITIYLGSSATPATLVDDAITPIGNGGEIRVVRESNLYHPDVNGGNTATKTAVTTFTLDRLGLQVQSVMTYLQPLDVKTAYVMFPLNGVKNPAGGFDRVGLSNLPTTLTFTGLTGDNQYGFSKSGVVWVWQSTGKLAVMLWVPDIYGFTEGWSRNSVAQFSVQDRAGDLTKIYGSWISAESPYSRVPAGYVKTRTARYLVAYLAAGAESVLASV